MTISKDELTVRRSSCKVPKRINYQQGPQYLTTESLYTHLNSTTKKRNRFSPLLLGKEYKRGIPDSSSVNLFEQAKLLAKNYTYKHVAAAAAAATSISTTTTTTTTTKTNTPTTIITNQTNSVNSQQQPSKRQKLQQQRLPTTSFLPKPLPVNHIKHVQIGPYVIDNWYLAPYPEEYSSLEKIYVCEFCLKYMKSEYTTKRHQMKCTTKYPPGNEIYRDNQLSIFEIDGRKSRLYCQNLCLLAKMFLNHKTLYYDVEGFLFYVLVKVDKYGCHFVGYFSKEKSSLHGYNLSCIMTLPCYQRKGYGQFLIDFSYLLSKREGKIGSPEKPLSYLGLLSYQKYWIWAIKRELEERQEITLEELSKNTSITIKDIISTLKGQNMLQKLKNGKHEIIFNKSLSTATHHSNTILLEPEKLIWTPFLISETTTSRKRRKR
ncbi:acyl-CoA N-acyltransferase [Cokeromyces recurvatus]|uniref:acyl-CoA N-acyltransferase n=1 Tax=Cokeromyces recurvatus TaxID=90255 RepID=UPI00221FDE00|nr:acyl-CoA N-acyltransferase [Cokeromyces recurvatus]KAI7900889.1 acyl-CoA N-acyltransferase [Cokeromyces recurvatus]